MQLRVARHTDEGDDELICSEVPERPGLWLAGPTPGRPGESVIVRVSRSDDRPFEGWRAGVEDAEVEADAGGMLRVRMVVPSTVGEEAACEVHLFPGPLTLVVRLLAIALDEPDEADEATDDGEDSGRLAEVESVAAAPDDSAAAAQTPVGTHALAEADRGIVPAPRPPSTPAQSDAATAAAPSPAGSTRGATIACVSVIVLLALVFAGGALVQHSRHSSAPEYEMVQAPPMAERVPAASGMTASAGTSRPSEFAGNDTIRTYHRYITDRDFDAAWRCFTPQRREAMSRSAWRDGFKDTVESVASDFRTLSESGDSARVECTIRYLDRIDGRRLSGRVTHIYSLRRIGGEWLIADSKGVEGSHQQEWLD